MGRLPLRKMTAQMKVQVLRKKHEVSLSAKGKKGNITLNENHEISKSNANRLGFQKQPIITLVHLWVPPLDCIQSSLGAEGLKTVGFGSVAEPKIDKSLKHTLRSAPP